LVDVDQGAHGSLSWIRIGPNIGGRDTSPQVIGQIKNIRFTYQLESLNMHRPGEIGWAFQVAPQQCGGPIGCPPHISPAELERVMPAITSLAYSAAAPIGRALVVLAGRAKRGLKELGERVRNRRDSMQLAALDDRMLADIGLTRSDLRDAYAEPLWRDPSDVLARRAAEQRASRLRLRSDCVDALRSPSPPLDRPARHLI
jgi:uncharacterized protein YjiS (DUF1127 family)